MNQVIEVYRHIRGLGIDPLAVVVGAALVAALLEQRMTRKRTPDFSAAYRDIAGRPDRG